MKQIEELLNRKMTRKEFLQYTGTALLGVIGIGGLLKSLSLGSVKKSAGRKSMAYSSNAYGGFKR